MYFPIIELIDRLAIAEVKYKKTNLNQDEVKFYHHQLRSIQFDLINEPYQQLISIHEKIWNLESSLRQGHEDKLGLEEIGRRAIQIRNWNNKRLKLRNQIADIVNIDTIRECKVEHLSSDD